MSFTQYRLGPATVLIKAWLMECSRRLSKWLAGPCHLLDQHSSTGQWVKYELAFCFYWGHSAPQHFRNDVIPALWSLLRHIFPQRTPESYLSNQFSCPQTHSSSTYRGNRMQPTTGCIGLSKASIWNWIYSTMHSINIHDCSQRLCCRCTNCVLSHATHLQTPQPAPLHHF